MRITDARVIVCSPGRNFVTLKIVTEDGIHGLGDATLNGRELAVASISQEHVVPLLIGRDARRIEDTWQYLYKGAYWRRGPVTMTAICRRRHRLVGHPRQVREPSRLPAARWRITRVGDGLRPCERHDHRRHGDRAVGRYVEMGYKAVRAQCAVPGNAARLRRRPRVSSTTSQPKRADRRKRTWSTERYLDFVPVALRAAAALSLVRMCICCTTSITG